MGWITENLPSMLAGLGIILLLALLTRGNLKGRKGNGEGEENGGCAGCSCQGSCEREKEQAQKD